MTESFSETCRWQALLSMQFLTTATPLAVVPFLSLYMEQLAKADPSQTGIWTVAATVAPSISALLVTPLWGYLAVTQPLFLLLFSSCILTALSYLAMALANDAVMFTVARTMQGISGSGILLMLSVDFLRDARHHRYVGLQKAFSAGCLIGPALGGYIFDWRIFPQFLLGVVVLFLALSATCAFLFHGVTASRKSAPSPGDGIAAQTAPRTGNLSYIVAASLGVAGAFGFVPFFAQWAQDTAGLSASAIGILHTASWSAAIIALPAWNRLIGRRSPKLSVLLSLTGTAGAYLALQFSSGVLWIAAMRVAHGAFYSGLTPALYAGIHSSARRARELVAARTAMMLGQILGPLFCALAIPFAGISGALLIAALLPVAGALLIFNRRIITDHDQ